MIASSESCATGRKECFRLDTTPSRLDDSRDAQHVRLQDFKELPARAAAFPRRKIAPGFIACAAPDSEEGAGNAGSWPPPWPVCKTKSRRQSPQVQPSHPGIPCTTVLTLISRSPWEPGFLAPIASRIIMRKTWPQRREARTTRFYVRPGVVRPCTRHARRQSVHRIPRPRSVTIGHNALFKRGGTARIMLLIRRNVKLDFENRKQLCDTTGNLRMTRTTCPSGSKA